MTFDTDCWESYQPKTNWKLYFNNSKEVCSTYIHINSINILPSSMNYPMLFTLFLELFGKVKKDDSSMPLSFSGLQRVICISCTSTKEWVHVSKTNKIVKMSKCLSGVAFECSGCHSRYFLSTDTDDTG